MKKKLAVLGGTVASLGTNALVFAESTAGTANTDVVNAMTTVANDMKATGNSLIPIALGVVGLAIVVVFGIRIFKRIVSK